MCARGLAPHPGRATARSTRRRACPSGSCRWTMCYPTRLTPWSCRARATRTSRRSARHLHDVLRRLRRTRKARPPRAGRERSRRRRVVAAAAAAGRAASLRCVWSCAAAHRASCRRSCWTSAPSTSRSTSPSCCASEGSLAPRTPRAWRGCSRPRTRLRCARGWARLSRRRPTGPRCGNRPPGAVPRRRRPRHRLILVAGRAILL